MGLPRNFVLAGFEEGKTVNKGGFQFTNGVFTLNGAHEPTVELATYLERAYYAFPEGSQALKEANERYAREQKSGKTEAAVVADGAADEQPSDAVKQAVDALDHENNEHWTEAGKPSVSAVSDLAGEPVTRQAVELAAPGYNRAAAKAAANI